MIWTSTTNSDPSGHMEVTNMKERVPLVPMERVESVSSPSTP